MSPTAASAATATARTKCMESPSIIVSATRKTVASAIVLLGGAERTRRMLPSVRLAPFHARARLAELGLRAAARRNRRIDELAHVRERGRGGAEQHGQRGDRCHVARVRVEAAVDGNAERTQAIADVHCFPRMN